MPSCSATAGSTPVAGSFTVAVAPEAVEPQVFDLILDLIEHRDRVVTRSELLERVWHGRFVSDATLSSRIKSARQAIGDNGRDQRLIRTIHGRGFRFVAKVRLEEVTNDALPLDRAVADMTADGNLHDAGQPAPLAEAELEETHAGEIERRHLTIVRCTVADSLLALGALDPEEFAEFSTRAKAILSATFAAHGGNVARTYPAGLLVYFGWPRALEDAVQMAVRAALAVGPALGNLASRDGTAVTARCGVATGMVLVGGAEAGEHQLAIGRAPVLAARLMDLAERGTVVVAESTRALLGGTFALEERDPDSLPAVDRGVRLWRVLGQTEVATRFLAAAQSRPAQLVGRAEEEALLRRRWERARAGEGQVVLISGDPGIGKSRLVHDLSASLKSSEYWRIFCQCLPHHENSVLHPAIREIERAAGLHRDDDSATRMDKIRHLLTRTGSRSAEAADLLAGLVGEEPEMAASGADRAAARQEMTLEVLTDMVRGLARQRATLFIVEDAHWIDPTTGELLRFVVELAAELRLLVLITHRAGFVPPWAGRPHVSRLSLSRLTRPEAAEIARRVAGTIRLPEVLQLQIAERTDGVPLYVEELTRAVLSSSVMREASESGESQVAVIPAEIPATLRDLLLSQIDRLGAAAEIAKIGATIGRSFDRELVCKLTDLPASTVRAACEKMEVAGLIFSTGAAPQQRYVFKHVLVQDAAYSALTHGQRKLLHGRVATALEEGLAPACRAAPETLAHHFELADDFGRALTYWRRAGESAAAKYAHTEATAHFQRALTLIEQLPADRNRLQPVDEIGLADSL